MMGRGLFAVLVVLAFLLSPTAIGAADLDSALAAYNRGDFATAFKEWKELAEKGDAVAQSNLGQLYRDGEGVARDDALAAEWFRKAAEQGDAAAQNDLGSLYSAGRGVRKDDAEALRWYRKAADQGHSSGQFNLGLAYDYGRGVAQDSKEAMRWYRKAADQGNAWAQTNIGFFYYRGNGVSRDYAEAMRWYQKAAAQGDDVAWRSIGDVYRNGEGVTRDYGQAAAWYGKAAKQGNADAQLALAKLYEAGSGVSKDETTALLWYRKAADQGNEEAKTAAARLGKVTASMGAAATAQSTTTQPATTQPTTADLDSARAAYDRGDYARASKEFKKLAEKGDRVAQYNLGLMYWKGQGVAKDNERAVQWYRKSADQGYADAQYKLGNHYWEGKGVRHDDAEAVRWYRKSADQGNAWGEFYLGYAYAFGRGVARDRDEAMRWYHKAADQGNAWAQNNIGILYEEDSDYTAAMRWYRMAAAQGDGLAWKNVGDLYYAGNGVERDYAAAATSYGTAADHGDASAQLALGQMLEAGLGVPKDSALALHWYRKAADQGNEEAKTAVARLGQDTASTATAEATTPPSDADFSQAQRETIQQDLAALGFYEGKADGSFGSRSREAVRAFQRANNAEATGYLTVAQAASLAQQAAIKRAQAQPQPAGTTAATTQTTPAANAPAIAIPDDLEPIDRQFTAREPLNVRTEAKLGATIAATLAPGDSVTVLGKVHGKDWYLVGKGDAPLGYVANIELGSTHATAASVPPTPEAPAAAPATTAAATPYADIPFGRYHALVIGNNDYKELPKLDMAVVDARAIADLLRGQYDFDVELLIDVTRNEVMASLAALRRRLTSDDNLVIFYSGHGYYDDAADRGYWLPVDADRDNPANWVSNADITDMIKAMQARHVLIVADSCYSGTLTRGGSIALHDAGYIRRMVEKRGRTVLTSGGLEPVLDAGGAGHSVFARAFIDALKENIDVLDGQQLFARVREPVTANAEQTPEYGAIRFAGHDGGDFIFIRRN